MPLLRVLASSKPVSQRTETTKNRSKSMSCPRQRARPSLVTTKNARRRTPTAASPRWTSPRNTSWKMRRMMSYSSPDHRRSDLHQTCFGSPRLMPTVLSQISVTPVRSPLKIKFKVRPPPALARAKRLRALTQVQSESETSESEEETLQNSRLTKRQAALARARHNGGSSQSSGAEEDGEEDQIDPSSQNKRKTVLDATEIALRKEESARKRRNVTEKKLQDEKAETINRLLKKSARPRGKRGPAMGTALPTPVEAATPMLNSDGEAEGGEDPMFAVAEDIYTPPPMMYRWVSTTRPPAPSDAAAMEVDGDEKHMSLSFAIPGDFLAGLDHQPGTEGAISAAPSALAPICGVSGCGLTRKYRLVGGEWGSGACGMDHLKLLQAH
ncbi:unnamed protein product [Mycena citricolor]|uniref:INO80 complex subunit B-like conserved region domain-containing protein n=1 Tax=Mycena citricolor TaxID=2018698 RepID=A0AAD2K872_9AGAR|nr:unnamed protein product [Mycena citricolor]